MAETVVAFCASIDQFPPSSGMTAIIPRMLGVGLSPRSVLVSMMKSPSFRRLLLAMSEKTECCRLVCRLFIAAFLAFPSHAEWPQAVGEVGRMEEAAR